MIAFAVVYFKQERVKVIIMERETRLELATYTLARYRSTS